VASGGHTVDTLSEIIAGTELSTFVLLWAVIIGAAIIRAFTGFGFALASVPVFSLFMPPAQAVVLSGSLSLLINVFTVKTYWGEIPLQPLLPLFLASAVGIGLGVVFLKHVDPDEFQLLIGAVVIMASLVLSAYRPGRLRPTAWHTGVTGFAAGLMNGAFSMGGPPLIIYAMATEPDPARSRAFLMTCFLFTGSTAIIGFALGGLITPITPALIALSFPAMYIGDKIGYYLFHRFGTLFYRRVALVFLFGVGLVTMGKALVG